MTKKSKNGAVSRKNNERKADLAMTLFIVCLVAELYLLRIKNMLTGTLAQNVSVYHLLQVLPWIGAGLVLFGIVGYFLRGKCKWLVKPALRHGMVGVGAFFLLSALAALCGGATGAMISCIVLPALFLMALVVLLYPAEFAVEMLAMVFTLAAAWLCHHNFTAHQVLAKVFVLVLAVLIALLAYAVYRSQKTGGVLRICKKNYPLFSGADYRLMYAVCALGIVALLVALFFAPAAYYVLWVAAIVLFLCAVYHTVKIL